MRANMVLALLLAGALGLAGCTAGGVPLAQTGGGAGQPPLAVPDILTVKTNSLDNIISALSNDIDLSGTGLTITAVSVAQTLPQAAGAVASTGGDSVIFTPPSNFTGIVTLQYIVQDGTGATSSGIIIVSVLPVAIPPVALPDVAVVTQDSGANDIDVLANDLDFSGGGLTLTGLSVAMTLPPATHTVAISNDQVRFTPAAGFVGVVVMNYTATDLNGNSASGLLSVVVSPLALPVGPVALPDAAVLPQDSGASDIDVLANDVDPAGGGLSLTGVTVVSALPSATHAVAISADLVRFTPAAGFAGAVVVSYTATDVNGDSADGLLSIVVFPLDMPTGPVALPDAVVVTQDSAASNIDVLANDVDPAAGGLSLSGVAVVSSLPSATHTVTISGDLVRFTPAPGFAGVVLISYTATDVNGNSADGQLSIMVTPLGLAVGPVAIPDAAVVTQDSGATDIDVLANDVDPAGGGLDVAAVSVVSSLPPAAHTVAISGNQVRFTPAAGFAGAVVVSYTATDANGNTSVGLLNIVVSPSALALPPIALTDLATVSSSGGAVLIDVVANDIDPAGGGLTLTNASILIAIPPGAGSVAIVGNQIQYTPALLYIGVVTVTYTVTDINGNTSVGALGLTVLL